MFNKNILIEQTDPELFAAIQSENQRQQDHIELIASENYASPSHDLKPVALTRQLRELEPPSPL